MRPDAMRRREFIAQLCLRLAVLPLVGGALAAFGQRLLTTLAAQRRPTHYIMAIGDSRATWGCRAADHQAMADLMGTPVYVWDVHHARTTRRFNWRRARFERTVARIPRVMYVPRGSRSDA